MPWFQLGLSSAALGLYLYQQHEQPAKADLKKAIEEELKQKQADGPHLIDDREGMEGFSTSTMLNFKSKLKEEFKIPYMLEEREKKKKEEYMQREPVDIEKLGLSRQEWRELKEQEHIFGSDTAEQEIKQMEEDE